MQILTRLMLTLSLAVVLAGVLPGATAAQNRRLTARYGFEVGALSEPVPSVVSFGLCYAVNPRVRLHGAVGGGAAPSFLESVDWTIWGAGATYMMMPARTFSPAFGASINAAHLEQSSPLLDIFGLDTKQTYDTVTFGLNAGFDWQTQVGFNAALGAAVWFDTSDTPLRDVGALPYLRLGWMF